MNDNQTSIQEIKDKIAMFDEERNWIEAYNPKDLSMSIAIEAAELMEIFQWMSVEEAKDIGDSEEFTHLKEELSDVIIYCLSLANQLDIDVSASIEDKIKKNGKKYPKE
ncbi:MAG: nucleotide pyrophosphohydrolase [Clostridiaceae bacterium]|nr:nucleotide pyrophosphohydrolase [Clostridiaceae bacterium]